MHDAIYFEMQGKPSIFVATSEFVGAAQQQASMLGLEEVRRVFIPHPMQDRTDEEMHAHAERFVDEILDTLMRPVDSPAASAAAGG